MSWLRKFVDAVVPTAAPTVNFDPAPHIRHAVLISGLTRDRPEDIDFYVSAYAHKRLDPRHVRQFGTLLSDEEKAALGVPASAILAHEFIATLNDRGRADPGGAARAIAQPAAQRCRSAIALLKIRETAHARACLHAAAGSCPQAAALNGARMTAEHASLLPLPDCDRPDRCECRYEATYEGTSDMDDVMI